jgi:NAD/NADP transhydrogenase alpha subunit
MYSRNVTSLLDHLVKEDVLTFDPADEIAGACVARGGQIVDDRVRAAAGGAT